MTVDAAKLVRMAEQVAANLDFDDNPEELASRVADHLDRFWDPRMKVAIKAHAAKEDSEISETLRAAVARLSA